ncbi:hypothetical protein MBRA_38320 [Mycobacterium branderi]|uniref:Uncharacterized protein n=1 Tax=Mycobacterium branderi TaxID=43348 RepID=A0ABM7KRI4_9MYCO|nr:hypothetical protein MBRA_38320 [Mycobacterium branderi]
MREAGDGGDVETDHFQLAGQRRVGKWPTGGKPCGKGDQPDIHLLCLLLELVDTGWLREIGGDDTGLNSVCRSEVTGDRQELFTAPRRQDDINATGGDLGGQRFTDPIAGSGD